MRLQQFISRPSVTLLLVGLFGFQLSRTYLVIPVDSMVCKEAGHSHNGSPEANPAAAHHHDEMDITPLHEDDDTRYFRHCKDSLDGLSLTSPQSLCLPAESCAISPAGAWVRSLPETASAIENALPPPFQPPRNLL